MDGWKKELNEKKRKKAMTVMTMAVHSQVDAL